MQLNLPDSILQHDDDVSPQTRWPPRIPTEGHLVEPVIRKVNARLRELPFDEPLHHYDFANMTGDKRARMPYGAWIACYPVRGSNEGYYVQITAICRDGTAQILGSAKCETEELAMRLANVAFMLLEA